MIARMLIVAGLLGSAAPANAQITDRGWTPGRPAPRLSSNVALDPVPAARELRDLREQVDHGRDGGTLSRREARRFRAGARVIGSLAERYGRDGFSDSDRAELAFRIAALRDQVSSQRMRGAAAR